MSTSPDMTSGAAPVCDHPIFIIGSPRSGTTGLARSLAEHSELRSLGEPFIFAQIFGPSRVRNVYHSQMSNRRWLWHQRVGQEELFESLGLGINALMTRRSQGKRWIDKTPEQTLMANELADMFPGASFIHMLRDGRSVVHSMIHYLPVLRWRRDFRLACTEWRQFVHAAMAFEEKRADRCLTVRYHDLVADPDEGFDQIFDFLDVAHEAQVGNFFRSKRIRSSFADRAGGTPSDPWQEWTIDQKRIFVEEASSTMVQAGLASSEEMLTLERETGGLRRRDVKLHSRAMVFHHAPPGASILVVNLGDQNLLRLGDRTGQPFPHFEEKAYIAHSREAITQLEQGREDGADYLLVPSVAFGWMEHYAEFQRYVDDRYHRVHQDEECVLFALWGPNEPQDAQPAISRSKTRGEVIQPQTIHQLLREVKVCRKPIFVIGSPRSGTTILARALAKHSQLWTSDETMVLSHLYGEGRADEAFRAATFPPIPSWLNTEGVNQAEFLSFLGVGVNALFTSRSGGKRWIDQTPAYTYMTHLLVDMFPDAHFLHILRDGRSAVHSMIHFLDDLEPGHKAERIARGFVPRWYSSFGFACEHWEEHVTKAMEFVAQYPDRCLTVRHEELVAEPEDGFRRVFRFIEVPDERAPSEFFRTSRVNSSFRVQPGGPAAPPQQRPRAWITWTQEQKQTFVKAAGVTMLRYGLISEEELWQMDEEARGLQDPGAGQPSDRLENESLRP